MPLHYKQGLKVLINKDFGPLPRRMSKSVVNILVCSSVLICNLHYHLTCKNSCVLQCAGFENRLYSCTGLVPVQHCMLKIHTPIRKDIYRFG